MEWRGGGGLLEGFTGRQGTEGRQLFGIPSESRLSTGNSVQKVVIWGGGGEGG